MKSWTHGTLRNRYDCCGASDFASFKTIYASLKKYSAAIPRVQTQLLAWRKRTISWLGSDLDKDELLETLKSHRVCEGGWRGNRTGHEEVVATSRRVPQRESSGRFG